MPNRAKEMKDRVKKKKVRDRKSHCKHSQLYLLDTNI